MQQDLEARAVLKNQNTSQKKIDKVKEKLEKAIASLEKKEKPSKPEIPVNSEKPKGNTTITNTSEV